MRTVIAAAAVTAVAASGAAQAQGFRGAEIDLSSSAYTEDSDFGQTTFQGSVEFGFTERFGVALDIGGASFRPDAGEAGTATVHLVFDVAPNASLGVFSSADESDSATSEAYGIEGGAGFGRTQFEAFAGLGTAADVLDFSVYGVDGVFGLSDRFALTTSFAYLATELDVDQSRLGIGTEVRLGSTSTLYVEVGEDNLEGETATYVGLGARFAFGPQRGTTFDPRGLVEVFGGF